MSCDHDLANEWARCSGKNASYITIHIIKQVDKTKLTHFLTKDIAQGLGLKQRHKTGNDLCRYIKLTRIRTVLIPYLTLQLNH